MFVDECHVTRLNQGLFSTTMEAEKRDPGNEVAAGVLVKNASIARTSVLHVQRITNQAIPHVSVPATGVCRMEESVNGAWFLFLQLIAKKVTRKRWS